MKSDYIEPLRYPENKPSEEGWYIAYDEELTDWGKYFYSNVLGWVMNPAESLNAITIVCVKWFFPDRLDEPVGNPDELESEDNMSGREPRIFWDGDSIAVTQKRFKNLQESDAVWFHGLSDFADEVGRFLKENGYDVVKRKPELKPCPFCGGECSLIENKDMGVALLRYQVQCQNCSYKSSQCDVKDKIVSLHNNLIAGKGE